MNNRSKGIQISKLRRYKMILDLYEGAKKKDPSKCITKILKEDICPIYYVSRTTLYKILDTPVVKLLKELGVQNEIDISKSENFIIRLNDSKRFMIRVTRDGKLTIQKLMLSESTRIFVSPVSQMEIEIS